jgi:hypothetical protein
MRTSSTGSGITSIEKECRMSRREQRRQKYAQGAARRPKADNAAPPVVEEDETGTPQIVSKRADRLRRFKLMKGKERVPKTPHSRDDHHVLGRPRLKQIVPDETVEEPKKLEHVEGVLDPGNKPAVEGEPVVVEGTTTAPVPPKPPTKPKVRTMRDAQE